MSHAQSALPETAENLKPIELSPRQWAELELEHYTSFTVTTFSSIASLWASAGKTLAHHRTPSDLQLPPLGTTHLWNAGGGTLLMTIEASGDLWLASDPIDITDVAAVAGKPGPDAARAVLEFLFAVRNQRTCAAARLAGVLHAGALPNPDVYLASSDGGDAWTCPTCLSPITWLDGGDQLGSMLADITAHRCPPSGDLTQAHGVTS